MAESGHHRHEDQAPAEPARATRRTAFRRRRHLDQSLGTQPSRRLERAARTRAFRGTPTRPVERIWTRGSAHRLANVHTTNPGPLGTDALWSALSKEINVRADDCA